MTLSIALISLLISFFIFVNDIKRKKVSSLVVEYRFQNTNIKAAYFDTQKKVLQFPHYGSEESAGFDLKSAEVVTLDPGQFITVKTGVHFNIPKGYEIQIRSRSGLAAKEGIHVLNSPGTVDSDYTGEVKIILRNSGANKRTIEFGERIAQAVLAKIPERPIFKESSDFNTETLRGHNGLGSTGTK